MLNPTAAFSPFRRPLSEPIKTISHASTLLQGYERVAIGVKPRAKHRCELSDSKFLFLPSEGATKRLPTKQRGAVHRCSTLKPPLSPFPVSESDPSRWDRSGGADTSRVYPFLSRDAFILYVLLPFSGISPSIFVFAAAYQGPSGSWRASQQSLDGSAGHTRGGHVNSRWKATCGGLSFRWTRQLWLVRITHESCTNQVSGWLIRTHHKYLQLFPPEEPFNFQRSSCN